MIIIDRGPPPTLLPHPPPARSGKDKPNKRVQVNRGAKINLQKQSFMLSCALSRTVLPNPPYPGYDGGRMHRTMLNTRDNDGAREQRAGKKGSDRRGTQAPGTKGGVCQEERSREWRVKLSRSGKYMTILSPVPSHPHQQAPSGPISTVANITTHTHTHPAHTTSPSRGGVRCPSGRCSAMGFCFRILCIVCFFTRAVPHCCPSINPRPVREGGEVK